MTLRLIGLMSIVLFLCLSALGLLLKLSQDAVMEEVTRTVSTVGAKTLAAFVEEIDDQGGTWTADGQGVSDLFVTRELVEAPAVVTAADLPDPVDTPAGLEADDGTEDPSSRPVARQVMQISGRFGGVSEGGVAGARPPVPEGGTQFVMIRMGTFEGSHPDDPSEDCDLNEWMDEMEEQISGAPGGGFPSSAQYHLFLPGANVRTEVADEEVRAHIPIFRHIKKGMVELKMDVTDGAEPAAGAAPDRAIEDRMRTFRDELVVKIPTQDYESIFDRIRGRALFLFLGVFVVGMVLSAGLARRFTRPIRQMDVGLRRLSGGDLDVQVDASGGDEVARLGQVFNDMTRELKGSRQREQEIVRQEKLSALGRLAAGVAHDVRNPLHSINLTLEHLRETCRPQAGTAAEFDRSVETIRGEIRRLDGLVENFLRFARTEHGPLQEVLPAHLVSDTVQLVAKEAERRKVALRIEAPDDGVPIRASAESLRSALLNLVLNSFEAMPDGGELRISCGREGDQVVFEVEDNGIGISAEDQARVFEFGHTTREDGYGLGLAMVHQSVVTEHGGQVTVKSQPGEGTLIRLELPGSLEEPA